MYGCQANYLYAIKCLFKDYPNVLISTVFISSIPIFAYVIRICQRPLYKFVPQTKLNFQNFQNALWLTIVTMTTVGYGDFYPRTQLGSIINLFLVTWGILIISIMVVVVTNTLQMSSNQKRVLVLLNRLNIKAKLQESAANLLTTTFRYKLNEIKASKRQEILLESYYDKKFIKLKKYKDQFSTLNRYFKSIYDCSDINQQMTRQFQFLNDDLQILNINQEQLINYIHSNIQQNNEISK